MKPGVKLTDIGAIPDDWEAVNLGDRASFRTGPFGSALHKSDYTEDGIPVINPMHIIDGKIVPTRTMTITEDAAKKLSEFRLKAGQVILGRRGDMGRCAVIQKHQDGWLCGTGSIIIRCDSKINAAFLQRVISSPKVISSIEQASVGSTMINLNQGTLSKLRIQLPPFPEQHAIAQALGNVDDLIATLASLITKKRDIKQATMQQLLTGKTRLAGFNSTWVKKRFGDISDYVDGEITAGGDNGYIEIGDIDIEKKTYDISRKAKLSVPGAVKVPAGTLLISTVRPTRGAITVTSSAIHVSSAFCRLSPKNGLLFYLASQSTFLAYLGENSFGGTYPTCRDETILGYETMVPADPKEQNAIAGVLSDMDAELSALEARRDKILTLKQGMMQELLTGKTRLL